MSSSSILNVDACRDTSSAEHELVHYCTDARLTSVVSALSMACAEIAHVLRNDSSGSGGVEAIGSHNRFGDAQLKIDVSSQEIVMKHIVACGAVATASSEECPMEEAVLHNDLGSVFAVSFDPLDGSSIVDCNWSVGTIVSLLLLVYIL